MCLPLNKGAASSTEIVDIFRNHVNELSFDKLAYGQKKLLADMLACRTEELGGHLYSCLQCEYEQMLCNSCGNRSCSVCQSLAQERWISSRKKRILPVPHHHVVFTVPSELRAVFRYNQRACYDLLCDAVSKTLNKLARDIYGVKIGIVEVLHTWTRRINFHPHVHCLVTAGGLATDKVTGQHKWVQFHSFLFHVSKMKECFRDIFLSGLQRLRDDEKVLLPGERDIDNEKWLELIQKLPNEWCVHVQPPESSSPYVLDYLGRYTHRIAISNQRIVSVTDEEVTFRVHNDTQTITCLEFLERYLQHVLPRRLRRIRNCGLYAPANVNTVLEFARGIVVELYSVDEMKEETQDLDWVELLEKLTGRDPLLCPCCKNSRMKCILTIPRGPPIKNENDPTTYIE